MIEVEDETDGLTAHERVYRVLRNRILSGEMAPGDSLTLRGLAEELGVSMTPAREAVRRLVAERALAMTASGRVATPVPDVRTMEQLYHARMLLEVDLAVRALPRIDAAAIARLTALDADMGTAIASGSAAAYVRANNAFHSALYEPAEAPALMALVQSIWLQTAPMMRRIYAHLGTGTLVDYHASALAALAARNPVALAEAIRSDLTQGAALMAGQTG